MYAALTAVAPVIRAWWRRFPMGNVVDLEVRGRRSGRIRPVLLGLLQSGGRWFIGHPNGPVPWTLNLVAAGEATILLRPGQAVRIRARLLEPGPQRDRAIRSTTQHVFPGNLIYRLAWAHIRSDGAFFEIEPLDRESRH
jgi:hypothetical protein